MIQNEVTKDWLAIAGLISTPCFFLIFHLYNNGIKELKKTISALCVRIDNHIQGHLDNKK